MKAALLTKYGSSDAIQIREVEKPVPRDEEVLIKIHASTVTMGDCEIRNMALPFWTRIPLRLYMGYRRPKKFIPGMEYSGVIEAVGSKVTSLKKGTSVFGFCDLKMGGSAEYICRSVSQVAIKPPNVSLEAAATIPIGGINALHFLRKANIQPSQKVLIIGAGGSIGTYGVQLAKNYGAEVTVVDSTEKLAMLKSLGADHVIDYTREDFSENGKKYDVIFDMIYGSSFSKCIDALTPEGCYLMANPSIPKMLRALGVSKRSNKKVIFEVAGESTSDLVYLAELMEKGKIKAVIDRVYPLEKIVEAHDYVEKGQKQGNVVIKIAEDYKPAKLVSVN